MDRQEMEDLEILTKGIVPEAIRSGLLDANATDPTFEEYVKFAPNAAEPTFLPSGDRTFGEENSNGA